MAKQNNIEKSVYGWIAEVGDRIGADRVASILAGTLVGVARTKATLDKNLETLLAVANIPSRADYRKMQAKIDSLQGSVMSLSRTVEQLRDAVGSTNGAPTRAAKPAAATKPIKRATIKSPSAKSSAKSSAAATKSRKTRKAG